MLKRKRLAKIKEDLHNLGLSDLLSQLPNEVLVSILSKLPLKDAAVTSKLSRRWRYLWCQTDRLVFEDTERWSFIRNEPDSNAKTDKYMSWVNHIIDQHKSPTLDKFKIRFGFDENVTGAINEWIKYAISKNVQTLELDFMMFGRRAGGNYCFPNEIFDTKCGSSLEGHSFNAPVMEIKFLKTIILKCVDVNDEGLRKILSNCPVLENLSVHGSRKLVKAQIRGKDLALKNLDLALCHELRSVEICDSNIVSFTCYCLQTALSFDNLPKLEKICIQVGYSWKKLNDMFHQISCNVPNLQVLDFCLYCVEGSIDLHLFPELQKLKQLIIRVVNSADDGLLVLPFLVEAYPNLQRLTVLESNIHRARKTNGEVIRQMAKKTHRCLEVVEIGWYSEEGGSDLELATYFIRSCVALKKLVIKPFTKVKLGLTREERTEEINATRNRVREQLEPRTPVGVELVIL